jgi:hypothetical protein
MRIAVRVGNTFDILNEPETSASLVRNSTQVRLSWNNANGQLEQLVKESPISSSIGSLLVSKGSCLLATGDKQSSRTVAKLLADPVVATKTKQVVIDGITYTARLLPVQLL